MKFTIEREKLYKALQKVVSVVGARTTLPVLGNVLVEAKDGSVKFTSTDLEMRICTTLPAEVGEGGATTIPGKLLLSIVSRMPGAEVKFNTNANHQTELVSGSSRFNLLGLPADDFPEASDIESSRSLSFKEVDFRKMLGMVAYAVSSDESRKVLHGVLISCRDNGVVLVGTDGKRLAMIERTPDAINGTEGDVIVPRKTVEELRSLLSGAGTLNIEIATTQAVFTTDAFVLSTKLIEGNYPNYRQVIPNSFSNDVEFSTAEMIGKIDTVKEVLTDDSGYVSLTFADGELKFKAFSSDLGEAEDSMAMPYDGEKLEVALNPRFLSEPLRVSDADKSKMKMNDAFTPIAIETDEGFLYVIMPVRKR